MNGSNIMVDILKKEEEKRKVEAVQRQEWGITQRNRLVSVLEKAGANISNWMYDALLFNINGLRINTDGKICYLSFYPESKRIIELLRRYNNEIKQNFNYITKTI